MRKNLIVTIPIIFAIFAGAAFAQQADPSQAQPPKVVKPPAPNLTFADKVKQYLQQLGAAVEPAKSTPDMIVSTYPDQKGNKTTVVMIAVLRPTIAQLRRASGLANMPTITPTATKIVPV